MGHQHPLDRPAAGGQQRRSHAQPVERRAAGADMAKDEAEEP
jgi:hypothetical protein